MAKALQNMKLPPEVALMPDQGVYRAGQNQLIGSLFVGQAQAAGTAPDDLFKVTEVVKGSDAAGPLEDSGCKMTWPA
jgi:branched-chain amino acid transport system substrate-binding protein